ncbi:MAG: riboflavin synthase [Zetaproteobacteria bacterium]|nr:MAG: riboflavin synthase [Zetaproteobacteria bacterium]
MFTGIVQGLGRIVSIEKETDQTHMVFETSLCMDRWRAGDSVAVDGCCLTITGFPGDGLFSATLSAETLRLTRFPSVTVGECVNLEPALRVGDPLGGHWVSGHIDGLVRVEHVESVGDHRRLTCSVPNALAKYVVRKGSVAINGVSLTVNDVQDAKFSVNVIPHTLAYTNLGLLKAGGLANLETDLIGRYIERLLKQRES